MNGLPMVPRLDRGQISQFKRDGMLLLPGVLDPAACDRVRDQLWDVIGSHRPEMRRDDPTTWLPFTEAESEGHLRPEEGGDPYFFGRGHRLYVRNGAEQSVLDATVRPLWDIAEQLLGEGQVVWPRGVDDQDVTEGPCLMTERSRKGMVGHLGDRADDWLGEVTGKTENLQLPKTGPVWMTAQGARGIYCTLPNSPAPEKRFRGAHGKPCMTPSGDSRLRCCR